VFPMAKDVFLSSHFFLSFPSFSFWKAPLFPRPPFSLEINEVLPLVMDVALVLLLRTTLPLHLFFPCFSVPAPASCS
jgi:hypothetical protein